MKHLLPAFAFTVLSVHAFAQPVLDMSNVGTVVGDAYIYNAGPWLDPGAAGAAVTWDLTGLTSDSLIPITFVDPTTTPDGASFPAATIAAMDEGFYAYSEFIATGGSLLGMSNIPGEAPIVYSDPQLMVSYPCTYGTTWTDPFHAEFSVSGFPIVRDGTLSAEADAYGTLQLPWGTLTDVLRATFVEDYTDVTSLITLTVHREYTSFMQAGTHYPIVDIFSISTEVFGNTTTITGSHWLVNGSVGMPSAQVPSGAMKVYPDPAVDVINVDLVIGGDARPVLELLDVAGRIVERRDLSGVLSGQRTERFDVSGIERGLYVLRLTDGDRALTDRVVVQ